MWRILGLLLGCAAAGVHWDVLQVFAWATMLHDNARTLAPAAAIARTFSPEGRCRLCHAIEEGRRGQQEASPAVGIAEKPPLVPPNTAATTLAAPTECARLRSAGEIAVTRREAPPLPPPRIG